MPTGYTAGVQDGTITRFEDFAMRCARQFGALIEMRDEPDSAPVPDKFEVSDYHRQQHEAAIEQYAAFCRGPEGDLREKWVTDTMRRRKAAAESIERCKADRARYEAMLEQAKVWMPPTPDHEELKTFMVEQLTSSIEFDCGDWGERELAALNEETFDTWKASEVERLERSIRYHRQSFERDVKNAKGRTDWVRQLRESLSQFSKAE